MLTRQDLSQIRTVVEEVLDQKLKPVIKKLNKIEKDLQATNPNLSAGL